MEYVSKISCVKKRVLLEESLRYSGVLTLERLGDQFDPLCEFFQKRVLWREGETLLFLTFNIIINLIFPENFIELPQVVRKIWRFSPSILTIFINFSEFLTFPFYKETNVVSIKQVISTFLSTVNLLKVGCLTFL